MPFSYFSLSLSAAFVFLFAFYFAPHYPVAGQSIEGHKGGGGLKTNSVWSKNKGAQDPWIRHCYRNACKGYG